MEPQAILRLALDEGFSAAAIVGTADIRFDAAFRPYCEENLCGRYGANYACPPDCGTPTEMEAALRRWPRALVVQTKWPITDYTDTHAILSAKQSHNAAMLRLIARLRPEGHPGKMAGAGPCALCARCGRVDGKPCPFPEQRYSCMSAYCIHVRQLAEACGMEYTCSDGRLAFFGLYAYE